MLKLAAVAFVVGFLVVLIRLAPHIQHVRHDRAAVQDLEPGYAAPLKLHRKPGQRELGALPKNLGSGYAERPGVITKAPAPVRATSSRTESRAGLRDP